MHDTHWFGKQKGESGERWSGISTIYLTGYIQKTYNSVDFYSRVLYETAAIDLPQKQANNLPDCFPEYTLRCNSFLIRISGIKTFIRATIK